MHSDFHPGQNGTTLPPFHSMYSTSTRYELGRFAMEIPIRPRRIGDGEQKNEERVEVGRQ